MGEDAVRMAALVSQLNLGPPTKNLILPRQLALASLQDPVPEQFLSPPPSPLDLVMLT